MQNDRLSYIEKRGSPKTLDQKRRKTIRENNQTASANIYDFYDPNGDQEWYFDHLTKEKCRNILNDLVDKKDASFLICKDPEQHDLFSLYIL